MLICVLLPEQSPETMVSALLESVPRIALEPPYVWLDVRGMNVSAVHAAVQQRIGSDARFGAAYNPIAAQVAARVATDDGLVCVSRGAERDFLAARPLSLLGVEDPLLGWLVDVGISTCGELAAVEREAVEVRFGAEAVHWWRLARGNDDRRLFRPAAPEEPHASVDFVDYVVTDPERLIFTTNALLVSVCEQMQERGSHARRLCLRLPLANGTTWERTLRTARPTADRATWLRLARALLEKLTVPDAVSGIGIQVEATEAAASVQGDLFDTDFATANAVETAVARLIDDQGDVLIEPAVNAHPLIEQRSEYHPKAPLAVRRRGNVQETSSHDEPTGLTLQLLPEPRQITVETVRRRDHIAPVRYRDGQWYAIVHAAGPDRISGGQWDASYAREYFRAVTTNGDLVWLFRDAARDRWFLHGWWD